jgi:hypothetical protein
MLTSLWRLDTIVYYSFEYIQNIFIGDHGFTLRILEVITSLLDYGLGSLGNSGKSAFDIACVSEEMG